MVNFSKIRVGDEVTIRVKVTRITSDEGFAATTGINDTWCVKYTSVVTHTPAPREIKVGDVVTWGRKADNFRVLAMSGQRVWLVNVRNAHDERLQSLSGLEHVD